MPLPINAIWFPAVRTMLLSRNGPNAPAFFSRLEKIDRLGPRTSGERRNYWELPEQGLTKLLAMTPDATYELLGAPDGLTVPVALDPAMAGNDALFLVSSRRENPPGGVAQLEFLMAERPCPDASELHRHARDMLRLGQHDHVEAIWASPISIADGAIRLGPAQPAWPHGRPRYVDFHPYAASNLLSGLKVSARADYYVEQNGTHPSVVGLSPTDPREMVLLVWRSTLAARLNASGPDAFLQVFQDDVAKHLAWSIPFNRIPRQQNAVEQPVARGYFLPDSGLQRSPTAPGEIVALKFQGPLDIDDVVMLCISARPAELIEMVEYQGLSLQPYRLEAGDLRCYILCWLTTVDGLAPLAWSNLKQEIRQGLTERLEAELRKTAGSASIDAAAGASAAQDKAEANARAAAERASLVDSTRVFATADELRGVLDEWFATLDPRIIEKLCTGPAREPIPVANIARFLPVSIEGMLNVPSNWAVFERDAGNLQKQLAAVQHILDPSSGLPRGHLRSNTRIWRSIRSAMAEMPSFDEAHLSAVDAMLPNASGILDVLDPAAFYSTAVILRQLEDKLGPLPRDSETAEAQTITSVP